MFKRIVNFLTEVKSELTKVSWSTRKELLAATMIVVVTTAILTAYIGSIDFILSKLLSLLIGGR